MGVVGLIVGVGNGFTTWVAVVLEVQPAPLVTVTVYVVVAPGVTVILAVVAPVFHE